jgi:hypothetical protein
MSYFSELDAWLDAQIERVQVKSDLYLLKDEIKNKVLESFRNGQRACPKCNPRRQQVPREKVPATA